VVSPCFSDYVGDHGDSAPSLSLAHPRLACTSGTYPRIGVGFGGFDLLITAITCDVGDSGDFWLAAMFSKTVRIHPEGCSLYRIFGGESIAN
jgi:hypothetical protein